MQIQTIEAPELNITDLINVTERLCVILQEESRLMEGMKIAELEKFLEEKRTLTSVMEGYKNILENNPMILRSIPASTMEKIKKMNNDFEAMLPEYEKQVVKTRKVHSIVMDALKEVLKNRHKQNGVYNKDGQIEDGKKKIRLMQHISISKVF